MFGYAVFWDGFSGIRNRLRDSIVRMAEQGDYILIGHSLGGVLIRSALASLPAESRMPRHLFLLGSPVRASRIARSLSDNPIFRLTTRDCGQLLGSETRMAEIPAPSMPVTAILGVRGITGRHSPFGQEPNDGVVAVREAEADWITETLKIPEIHTLLPSSPHVARLIVERLPK